MGAALGCPTDVLAFNVKQHGSLEPLLGVTQQVSRGEVGGDASAMVESDVRITAWRKAGHAQRRPLRVRICPEPTVAGTY